MAAQATKMFSKKLTDTDIKKRLAIPAKILPSLPGFNGSHAVRIHLMYGTRIWPIVCTVRKEGYKKPVLSGGWRNFVICNNFNVGDRITMYRVQDEDGSHYRVEVEKPAAWNQHGALSLNHEVDETTFMELAKGATDTLVDHVISKPPVSIFGTNISDEATTKAHFKTEMKRFGITMDTDMGKPPPLSPYMAKEDREIKFFGLIEGGAAAYDTSNQLAATGKACCEIITDQRLSLDLVLRQPTPYAGVAKLDLTLATPNVEGV